MDKGFHQIFGLWKGFRKGYTEIEISERFGCEFHRGSSYLGVIERRKQKGARVVSECLDDLRVLEVIKWFSVFNRTEPNRPPLHHENINRLIYSEDPIPNQTGFIESVSIRLFGSRIICPGLDLCLSPSHLLK